MNSHNDWEPDPWKPIEIYEKELEEIIWPTVEDIEKLNRIAFEKAKIMWRGFFK